MTKIRGLLHFGVVLLAVSMVIFLSCPASAGKADDAHLVKIMPDFDGKNLKGLYISSQITNIKKDDLVIWMNGIVGQEVQIVFNDGKVCRDVTANPNLKTPGFFLDSKNCYTTSFLPYSSTSVLQFGEVGTYKYDVVSEDGKLSAKGQIIVRP